MHSDEVLGQQRPLAIINAYIEKSSFRGGFIFSGPESIGKKMAAKIIACQLNHSEKLQHPDIHIIEHEDAQIKIDDIRAVVREAGFRPYEGLMKIFIIDNAHRLNAEAANSLLKILEEPPKDVLIILITDKPQNIIKTVLSRCKIIKFSPLARNQLEAILIKDHGLDKNNAHFLAYYCEGRLGLALRLKDSPVFGQKNRIFDSLMDSAKPNDRNLIGQSKEQLRSSLNIFASWLRDIYILKAGLTEEQIIHLDRRPELVKLTREFSFKQLDDIMATISESLLYLDKNINHKLLLHNLGAQLWKV